MQSVMELGEKVSEIETKNFSISLNLVKKYLDSEFITCLLYIGKAEDKETHDKILKTAQNVRNFSELIWRIILVCVGKYSEESNWLIV